MDENNTRALTTTILLIATALLILPTASAAPTQGDCVIASTSPFSDYKAVASISGEGHLMADVSIFSNVLWCNQTMIDWPRNDELLSYASAGEVMGEEQGHISEAGVFGNALMGNWSSCQLTAGSCSTITDEACLVGVTSSGEVAGMQQGHAVACGTGTHSICCCPSGSTWNPVELRCEETGNTVFIVDAELRGQTNPMEGSSHSYEATVEWGTNSGVYVEFTHVVDGSMVNESSTTNTALQGSVDYTSSSFTFNNPSASHEVCVYAELTADSTVNTSVICEPINVIALGSEYITAGITGPTSSQVSDAENYTSSFTWGDNAGGITAEISVTAGGTTTVVDTYNLAGDVGTGSRATEVPFTDVGTNEVCVEAYHQNNNSVFNSDCMNVTVAASDFVDVIGLSGEQNNLSVATSYSYDADISWSGGDVDYLFFIRKVFNTSLIYQQPGTLTGFSGTNQPVSWSTTYPEAGAYYLNLTANNTQAQDSDQLYVTVGEQLTSTTQCQDLNSSYNSYACINTSETPDNDSGRYHFDSVSNEYFCAGNEDAYCRLCGAGFSWNASVNDCRKTTCNLPADSIYPECVPPSPLITTLTRTPASGPAPLNVSFEINITGGVDAVDYTLDFGYAEGSISPSSYGNNIFDPRNHVYEHPNNRESMPPINAEPYTVTLTANDSAGRTNSTTLEVDVTCVGSGQDAEFRQLCCAGLTYSGGTCWAPGDIYGNVSVNYSDNGNAITPPRADNEAVIRLFNSTGDELESQNIQSADNTYAFTNLTPDTYDVRASRPLSNETRTIPIAAGQSKEENFVLQDPVYNSDCTNAQGRCDANALGRNGCLMDSSDPDFENRSEVLYACDRRVPGSQVTIDRNGFLKLGFNVVYLRNRQLNQYFT